MARVGFLPLPWAGHLNPLCALAEELAGRGHQTMFFQLPEFGPEFEARGVEFRCYGEGLFPDGTFAARDRKLKTLRAQEFAVQALETTRLCGQALLACAGPVVAAAQVDLLVIDHLDYAGSILARSRGIPFVTAITTLMRHPEIGVPGFSGEPYQGPSHQDDLSRLVQPWREALDRFSRQAGLGRFSYDTVWSELAQVTQQPRQFEFPRKMLPACFHFTGPWISTRARRPVSFPWDELHDAPLVYASLGSVGQGNLAVLQAVVDAVVELPVQLILAGGEFGSKLDLGDHVLIRPEVPQVELLKRVDLMIHHAGMNSTLECLSEGVPMLVLPLASDQPGIGRRVERAKVGINLWQQQYRAPVIRDALEQLLSSPGYRAQAMKFRDIIRQAGGLQAAASIVEQAILGSKSVPPGER